ncbi:10027_t:CDS:1, partial [Cetraspora pellucida]
YSINSYDSINLDGSDEANDSDDTSSLDDNHYNVFKIRKQFLDADKLLKKSIKTPEMLSIFPSKSINFLPSSNIFINSQNLSGIYFKLKNF